MEERHLMLELDRHLHPRTFMPKLDTNWNTIGLGHPCHRSAQWPQAATVTQTSPWWEDRRLPGERFEPPQRSHDQRHSIDWLEVRAALPFSGHGFTDERERGSHTGVGRILRGFGGGLSR